MAQGAPPGNQFWKRRSKHGIDRIIQDPKKLAESIDEYFQSCIDDPIQIADFKGKDATKVKYEHPRPFLKNELARFCGLAKWESIEQLKQSSKGFMEVITRAEGIIADQKYTYAVINVFNANIVSLDLGLVKKIEQTKKKYVIEPKNDK